MDSRHQRVITSIKLQLTVADKTTTDVVYADLSKVIFHCTNGLFVIFYRVVSVLHFSSLLKDKHLYKMMIDLKPCNEVANCSELLDTYET